MNAEQLNVIKERAAKATPGPWESDCFGVGVAPYGSESDLAHVNEWDDATFIASCREDVPALVAEVERLRKALESINYEVYNDGSMTDIAWIVEEALECSED